MICWKTQSKQRGEHSKGKILICMVCFNFNYFCFSNVLLDNLHHLSYRNGLCRANQNRIWQPLVSLLACCCWSQFRISCHSWDNEICLLLLGWWQSSASFQSRLTKNASIKNQDVSWAGFIVYCWESLKNVIKFNSNIFMLKFKEVWQNNYWR